MSTADMPLHALARRHECLAWRALLVYLTFGIVLESLHGFKVGWYLDVSNDTRRLLLTLSHAHGTLLSLVNLAFVFSVRGLGDDAAREVRRAARALLAALVLLPAGFLLGGLITHSGDPGLGVLLVPFGALALLAGVALTARAVSRG